jgi:predicted amidophosphoribosyltransferase
MLCGECPFESSNQSSVTPLQKILIILLQRQTRHAILVPGTEHMENNIRAISGNWDAGFALDKHTRSSTYLGDDANGRPQFDTKRSEVGEALYQLKYRGDFSKVDLLAAEVATYLVPKFASIGLIIPMPPTNQRTRQPVVEIARALSARLMVPVFENILTKLPPPEQGAPQIKDLVGKEAKVAALAGRFQVEQGIANDGRWNVLIVDDLFDSGATMEAASARLREYHKIDRIFVAALTWK